MNNIFFKSLFLSRLTESSRAAVTTADAVPVIIVIATTAVICIKQRGKMAL